MSNLRSESGEWDYPNKFDQIHSRVWGLHQPKSLREMRRFGTIQNRCPSHVKIRSSNTRVTKKNTENTTPDRSNTQVDKAGVRPLPPSLPYQSLSWHTFCRHPLTLSRRPSFLSPFGYHSLAQLSYSATTAFLKLGPRVHLCRSLVSRIWFSATAKGRRGLRVVTTPKSSGFGICSNRTTCLLAPIIILHLPC